MSGAIIELISKGVQDIYITNSSGASFFKIKYQRHTNFAQVPKELDMHGQLQDNGNSSIKITSKGDLANNMWLEGDDLVDNLPGTVFDLYIGGQKVDSQTFDFMSDIWQIYMAETYTKSKTVNNPVSKSNNKFFPLHFFFCDNEMFLPLLCLQYSEVEIRVRWGSSISSASNVKYYANYVFLDSDERNEMISKNMEILITQVQRYIYSTTEKTDCDLSFFNHPIKSLYFGIESSEPYTETDKFTFSKADLQINGTYLFENMSPTYFHTVQGYYRTKYGVISYDTVAKCPFYTRYFTYNFCIDASNYKPTGTCNFSRMDNAKLVLSDVTLGSNRTGEDLKIYAVNYNILKIQKGIAGVVFGN
jgi:hypothetical protein